MSATNSPRVNQVHTQRILNSRTKWTFSFDSGFIATCTTISILCKISHYLGIKNNFGI